MMRFFVIFVIFLHAQDSWAAKPPCKNDYSLEQCTRWKAKDYCVRGYVSFMKQNCAALCKFCTPIKKESSFCATKKDKDRRCSGWKDWCGRNPYVNTNCFKTCCKEPSNSCSDGKWNGKEDGVDCGGPQCSPCPTVHGNWGDWSAFSACAITKTRVDLCEIEVAAPPATQQRTRKCDNPKPSNGGRSCGEKDTDAKPCKVCKKKCNSGKASEGNCNSWAKKYCNDKTYAGYMKDNCAVQCGICTDTEPPKPQPPTQVTNQGQCGEGMGSGRVVGGVNASRHEFPWQVGIWKDGGDQYEEFFCGGTLVRPNIVITASHCVENIWTDEIKLKFGDHITAGDQKTKGVVTLKAELIKMHPAYDTNTVNNDIAVIKLKGNVRYSRKIQPACLPTSSDDIDWQTEGKNCWITGWGKTKGGWTDPTTILQKAKMPIISKKDCKEKNAKEAPTKIADNMICAGPGPDSGVSGCQGDSGGPLVCENNKLWTLHGVVSWGDKLCRAKEKYTVFARVTYLRNWLLKTISEMEA